MAEPVIADRAVVAFDISVLLRVAGLDVIKPDASAIRPGDKIPADVLQAVVAANNLRFAAPLDDLIQRPNYPLITDLARYYAQGQGLLAYYFL